MPFFDDIRDQARAMRDTLAALPDQLAALEPVAARLRDGAFRRVVFTGMGGSFCATGPAVLHLIQRGVTAMAVESSELLGPARRLLDADSLCVAVSQSGESVEVARLLEELAGSVTVVGLTNTAGSSVARLSTATLCMRAGPEATVSTKTYTSTVASLHTLSRALAGDDAVAAGAEMQRAADCIARLDGAWEARMRDVSHALSAARPIRFVTYLGRGASRASADCSALVTKETAKLPTEGMLAGQYRHGPVEAIGPDTVIVIFSGAGRARDLNLALAHYVRGLGGGVVWIGEPAGIPGVHDVEVPWLGEFVTPAAEVVPVHWFAAHVAALRGFEPGTFRYIGKVTTVE